MAAFGVFPLLSTGTSARRLPRFTALNPDERQRLQEYFTEWGALVLNVLRPGGHVLLASNAFLAQLVFSALVDSGFEFRGQVIRLVQTLRGGDRPKNAEQEFPDVCTMPRGRYEPWGIFRKPIPNGMTVGDCLRTFQTGGLRRKPDGNPFDDVIESERNSTTRAQDCQPPQSQASISPEAAHVRVLTAWRRRGRGSLHGFRLDGRRRLKHLDTPVLALSVSTSITR